MSLIRMRHLPLPGSMNSHHRTGHVKGLKCRELASSPPAPTPVPLSYYWVHSSVSLDSAFGALSLPVKGWLFQPFLTQPQWLSYTSLIPALLLRARVMWCHIHSCSLLLCSQNRGRSMHTCSFCSPFRILLPWVLLFQMKFRVSMSSSIIHPMFFWWESIEFIPL